MDRTRHRGRHRARARRARDRIRPSDVHGDRRARRTRRTKRGVESGYGRAAAARGHRVGVRERERWKNARVWTRWTRGDVTRRGEGDKGEVRRG